MVGQVEYGRLVLIKRQSHGFTLIEVLIAATLLFLAISIGSVAFEQTLQTRGKLNDRVMIYQLAPLIKSDIKQQIRESNSRSGNLTLHGQEVSWRASLVEEKPTFKSLGGGEGGIQLGDVRLLLLDIEIEFTLTNQSIEYRELIWRE